MAMHVCYSKIFFPQIIFKFAYYQILYKGEVIGISIKINIRIDITDEITRHDFQAYKFISFREPVEDIKSYIVEQDLNSH